MGQTTWPTAEIRAVEQLEHANLLLLLLQIDIELHGSAETPCKEALDTR